MLSHNTTEGLISFLNTNICDVKTLKAYVPDIHYGKVIKVYDGDTVTIATPLHNGDILPSMELYKFSVRILGIDTPELKTKNIAEHELGIIARDALSEMIMNKVVRLENISYDKYGRILCNIFLGEINISEWLISNDHAVLYGGGTKLKKWGAKTL
jgi:micrococcal nuclease